MAKGGLGVKVPGTLNHFSKINDTFGNLFGPVLNGSLASAHFWGIFRVYFRGHITFQFPGSMNNGKCPKTAGQAM